VCNLSIEMRTEEAVALISGRLEGQDSLLETRGIWVLIGQGFALFPRFLRRICPSRRPDVLKSAEEKKRDLGESASAVNREEAETSEPAKTAQPPGGGRILTDNFVGRLCYGPLCGPLALVVFHLTHEPRTLILIASSKHASGAPTTTPSVVPGCALSILNFNLVHLQLTHQLYLAAFSQLTIFNSS